MTPSIRHAKPAHALVPVAVEDVLVSDVPGHILAQVGEEVVHRSGRTVGEHLHTTVREVPHPPANLRVAPRDRNRGRAEPYTLHVPGVIHALCHDAPSLLAAESELIPGRNR